MPLISQQVLDDASVALRNRAKKLKKANFGKCVSHEFSFNQLRNGLVHGSLQTWLRGSLEGDYGRPAIYRITAKDQAGASALIDRYDAIANDADFALSRRNNGHNGRTVYVGSSQKVADRLREHLQQASRSTFALHLRRWDLNGPHTLRVEVHASTNLIDAALLQDAEDALWDQSQPLFGRRGAK